MDEDYDYERPELSFWMFLGRILDPDALIVGGGIGAILASVVLYVLIRNRANREGTLDPQLGFKFALGFFKVLAYQLLLFGTFALTFGIIMKSEGVGGSKEFIYRPAFAMIVPAGILLGVHAWALTKTNQAEYPLVGRMLNGFSLILSGVFGTIGLFVVFQQLFQKGASGNPGRLSWALFLVYGTAWAVQAVRFYKRVHIDPLMAAPAFYPPPAAIAMPQAQPGVPGMPGVPGVVLPPPPPAPNQVPLPAPMSMPLAPPGSAPGSGAPGGTTL